MAEVACDARCIGRGCKELLVEFFFFPTYLAWFKNRPRLRLFAATMTAACLGNVYDHVLVYLPALARPVQATH